MSLLAGGGCQPATRSENPAQTADLPAYQPDNQRQARRQGVGKTATRPRTSQNRSPPYVFQVLAYVRANNRPMDGYVGGRRFGNFENHLPRSNTNGNPIRYQEWDVNPKLPGRNRGTERLITGSDQRAWFTNDHYNTFSEITP